jgi:hypothetical protein
LPGACPCVGVRDVGAVGGGRHGWSAQAAWRVQAGCWHAAGRERPSTWPWRALWWAGRREALGHWAARVEGSNVGIGASRGGGWPGGQGTGPRGSGGELGRGWWPRCSNGWGLAGCATRPRRGGARWASARLGRPAKKKKERGGWLGWATSGGGEPGGPAERREGMGPFSFSLLFSLSSLLSFISFSSLHLKLGLVLIQIQPCS